jgi:multidrug efflux pump
LLHQQGGLTVVQAYAEASKKMALPIISSTATTLAAFLPLIFWPGLAGEFMKYLPITLICVLTSSLFMALLFVPVLGTVLNNLARIFLQLVIPLVSALIVYNLISYGSGFNTISYLSIPLTIIKFVLPLVVFIFVFSKIIPRIYKITENKAVSTKEVSESAKILSSESNISVSNIKGFIGLYVKVISFLLNHRAKVIVSAIVVLIAVNFSYTRIGSGVEFFPSVEPDLAKIVVFARGNLSVEEKKDYVSRVENIILKLQSERQEFKNIYSLSGNVSEQSESSEDFIGSISLEYTDWDKRRKSKVILAEILEATKSRN